MAITQRTFAVAALFATLALSGSAQDRAEPKTLDLAELKPGQKGGLPTDQQYTVIGVTAGRPGPSQRGGTIVVRLGKDRYLAVSGVATDRLRRGQRWTPERSAVFTVLEPRPSEALKGKLIHHVTRHPEGRGFKR